MAECSLPFTHTMARTQAYPHTWLCVGEPALWHDMVASVSQLPTRIGLRECVKGEQLFINWVMSCQTQQLS